MQITFTREMSFETDKNATEGKDCTKMERGNWEAGRGGLGAHSTLLPKDSTITVAKCIKIFLLSWFC